MKSFGIVTQQGDFVRASELEAYAVKEGSRQLPTQETFEGDRGLIRPKYDPTHLNGLLETNTAHMVACRQKAEDVLGRGWEFVKTRADAKTEDRDRLQAWFDEIPPPETALDNQSYRTVFSAAQFDFEAQGRGVFELVREDRRPDRPLETLVHVPAHTIRVNRDGIRFVQAKGGKRRFFKWAGAGYDVDFESGKLEDLGSLRPERRANELVWWKNYHPADPVYGLPDIIPAIPAIHGDLGRQTYNIEFFSNFGIPAYAVFISGDFDEGDFVDKDGNPVDESDPTGKSEVEWHLQGLLKEVRDNPHSSLVFALPTRAGLDDGEVKIEFKPLATDVKEASFRLYRKDNREEVLSSHRMSAAIAGVYDAGAANREARGQYKQSVIWPRRTMLEQIVNHFVVRSFGDLGWSWKLLALDNRDSNERVEMAAKAMQNGGLTPRQFRQVVAPLLGIDPDIPTDQEVPELDRFFVNGQMLGANAGDAVGDELRGMRDDLVTMALKSGTDLGPLSGLLDLR